MTKKVRARFSRGTSSPSELTSMFPELVIPAADVKRCNDSWRIASLTGVGQRAVANSLELIDGLGKRYARMNDFLARGGTFANHEVEAMMREDHYRGTISAEDLSAGRRSWDAVNKGVIEAVGEAVGSPELSKATYKAYGARKPGVGLHRDSLFPNNDTTEVASVGLRGVAKFSVWAVPDALGLDMEELVGIPVDPAVGVSAQYEGAVFNLKPISTLSQGPGDIVHIDEAAGVWTSDTYGPMSIWHSVIRAYDDQPRLGAIIRS